jgi:acetoin utilization protein AcuA
MPVLMKSCLRHDNLLDRPVKCRGSPPTTRYLYEVALGKIELHKTPQGRLFIYTKCPPGFFAGLKLDSGIGNFSGYSSLIQKLDVFDKVAVSKDGRVSLAIADTKIIVGYLACWYPKPGERWDKLGELMYELGAIEVSRNFRKLGIARALTGAILSEDFIDDKIVYMNSFSWHWDLEGSRLTTAQYRKMMIALLQAHGFKEEFTNEPNVTLREENVFMVRIGSRVSEEDVKRFRHLRFGIVDH